MKTLNVKIQQARGVQHYPIIIGRGLLRMTARLHKFIQAKQVLIISNHTVAQYYLPSLLQTLRAKTASLQIETLLLPDGEHYKTLDELNKIFTKLLKTHQHRNTTLIALGGGVIGDMTGFAAACYQRGVAYIQIPTTLLAQVDSSIGGKTAVNHALGKNMMGAFHQPVAVFIDPDTLCSLPAREFNAGMAEVIKHAFIADAEFFSWLENQAPAILARDGTCIEKMIYCSCAIKMKIVTMDEKERPRGPRMWLNFGHTVGHAIEAAFGYGVLLHGEAVAIGMCVEAALSQKKRRLPQHDVDRLHALLTTFELPICMPKKRSAKMLEKYLRADKKNTTDQLTITLVPKLGQATVVAGVMVNEILTYL